MTRPSDPLCYDPSTPFRIQESVPTHFADKFSVGLTCQASNSEVACNVETDVRRGRSDDPESPMSYTGRGRGWGHRSGSRVVEQVGKTKYVDEYVYARQLFLN